MKWFGRKFTLVALCCIFFISPAQADVEIEQLSEAFDSFSIGGEINMFYRYDKNPWFGSGAAWGKTSTSYGETFTRIRLTAAKDLGWTRLSCQFAPYYAETIGKDFYAVSDNGWN